MGFQVLGYKILIIVIEEVGVVDVYSEQCSIVVYYYMRHLFIRDDM